MLYHGDCHKTEQGVSNGDGKMQQCFIVDHKLFFASVVICSGITKTCWV